MRRARVAFTVTFAAAAIAVASTVLVVDERPTDVDTVGSSTTAATDTSGPVSTTAAADATTTVTDPTTSAPASTATTTVRTTTTVPPTTRPPGPDAAVVVRRGPPDLPLVALTFDAGSDRGATAEILDLLAAEGIRATFGLTGTWARANPDLVTRIAAEGHQVLNHTDDHRSFTGASTGTAPLTPAERVEELRRAEAAIVAAGGPHPAPWFRPPYGDEDASVRADVAAAGYTYEVLWSVDSLGWRGIPVPDVVDRCLDAAGNGAIFLFHVGTASTDAGALPAIVAGLRARGFGFTTVADLITR